MLPSTTRSTKAKEDTIRVTFRLDKGPTDVSVDYDPMPEFTHDGRVWRAGVVHYKKMLAVFLVARDVVRSFTCTFGARIVLRDKVVAQREAKVHSYDTKVQLRGLPRVACSRQLPEYCVDGKHEVSFLR